MTYIPGSGGSSSISTSSDVALNNVAQGELLYFDAGILKWRNAANAAPSDASTTTKGIVQLAGDLGGTAAVPTVPGLSIKANSADVYTKTEVDTALGTKITSSEKGVAGGVATLGSDSKIPSSQLPAIAMTDVFVVASETEQLALAAQEGDVAVRSDLKKTFIHNGGTAKTLADWTELATPTDVVTSVNGQTGAVSLAKTDVGLGNVDNTSDANKPISSATQTALNAKLNTNEKGAAGGVASLDSDGKVPVAQLPALALTDISTVANQTEQLALAAQEGDVAVRSDLKKTFIHNGGTAKTMADWTELSTPTDAVTSVNGQTGVVTLTTSHISEGTNLYYTEARVAANTTVAGKVDKTTTISAGTGLTGGGDLTVNRTLSVTNDSTTQKIEVAQGGTLRATRKRLNFIAGSNITITAADDSAGNKTDITIASSATGTENVIRINAAYTAKTHEALICDAGAGGFTVTLPAVSNGARVRVKKVDSTTNAILVVPPSGTTIDASASASVNAQWQSQDFLSDGTIWYFI
ncbi:hypothetical protein CYG49_03980 [Candidatus Saccharibacteria bacterium]|nr:MAG: hypothetical protein CYG49_03980 [Candidatus Saccharibacteria bacterium]